MVEVKRDRYVEYFEKLQFSTKCVASQMLLQFLFVRFVCFHFSLYEYFLMI
jgi:hypothetical protein